jgi:hypothetical protein
MELAKAIGVGAPSLGLAGAAQVELAIAGEWVGFAPPSPSGKLQLHNATAELQGVSEPLQIASAAIILGSDTLRASNVSATFPQGPELSGATSFPLHCASPEMCVVHFDLRSREVSLARLNRMLNPGLANRLWSNLLTIGQRNEDALLKTNASGHFLIARLALGTAVATNVSGTLGLERGHLQVTDLRADLLGGKHSGTWTADFTASPPRFSGSGNLNGVAMAQLAALMHDNWASGTADARYSLSMRGLSANALRDSAEGSAGFTWNAGALRHVTLDGHGTPVAFSQFSGQVTLRQATFALTECKLQTGSGSFAVKGTASFDRILDVHLERSSGPSYVISGPLDKPRIVTVTTPAAEAALR